MELIRCTGCNQVFAGRLAFAKHRYKRTGKWDCLERMFLASHGLAILEHVDLGAMGRKPVWGVPDQLAAA